MAVALVLISHILEFMFPENFGQVTDGNLGNLDVL
jgi:hypothetical protein